MGQIRLTAEEIIDGDYPPVCISCGRKARGLVTRTVSTVRAGFLCMIRTSLEIRVPVCREHRVASWISWRRPEAKRIDDDGVVLKHVDPRFIDALEDYREWKKDEDRQRRRRRRRKDDEGSDEIDLSSLRRGRLPEFPEDSRGGPDVASGCVLTLGIVMGVLLLMALACGGVAFFLLHSIRPQ